jgi:hypothetical protein
MRFFVTLDQLIEQEKDIELVFEYLHNKFGFNTKHWKERFNAIGSVDRRGNTKYDNFIRFGVQHVQPVLNQILGRENNFNTFEGMVRYLKRDKIKALTERYNFYKYGNTNGQKK